jgi:hypothetical protein
MYIDSYGEVMSFIGWSSVRILFIALAFSTGILIALVSDCSRRME